MLTRKLVPQRVKDGLRVFILYVRIRSLPVNTNTIMVAPTTDPTKRNLTKLFDDTDIPWTAIEEQLLIWPELLLRGKELRLEISFNCVGNHHSSLFTGTNGEKIG
jgi:hypothetical protein